MVIFALFIVCSLKMNNPNSDKVPENEMQEGQNQENPDENKEDDSLDIDNSSDNLQEETKSTPMSVVFLNHSYAFSGDPEGYSDTEAYLHQPKSDHIEFYGGTYTQLVSLYDAEEDSDQLFAFVLYLGDYEGEQPEDYPVQQKSESREAYLARKDEYLNKKTEELIEWMGLTRLENYPYSYDVLYHSGQFAVYSPELEAYQPPECEGAAVVVGTIKQIKELCESGEAINGWNCRFASALRPDIAEYMNQKGYKPSFTPSGFYVSGWNGVGFGHYFMSSEILGSDIDWEVLLEVNVIE